jgi:3'(2'), 5'-bisphosphate nucleotidase
MNSALIPDLLKLITQAGVMILSFYEQEYESILKADNTPLTQADEAAHQIIVNGLNQLTPDVPILSEESEPVDFEVRKSWQEYWLVDPLDGTRDFLEKTGEFCVCIAYIKHNKPIFGMVYVPQLETHYYAHNNQAFKLINNQKQQLETKEHHNPLRVVVGHYSADNPKLIKHLAGYSSVQIFQLGSALKFCKIAEGEYDYYPKFGACSEWDSAAGAYILQSAGGRVVDENNNSLRYNTQVKLNSPTFFAFARFK